MSAFELQLIQSQTSQMELRLIDLEQGVATHKEDLEEIRKDIAALRQEIAEFQLQIKDLFN